MDEDVARRLSDLEARLRVIEKMAGIGVEPVVPPPQPVERPASPPGDRRVAGRSTSSIESLIGGHWLNRVGIAAVLVGVAYFLKYAFENEWIGPGARVTIGIVIGAALLAWSERFHARGYFLFSHTLKVVSVGVLYLSIWAASQTYALIGDVTAFASMAIVTAALVALAVRHRSEFIAGLAMTSGFLTPVLLSTGSNREVALFSYVALLDVAALALVAFFPWVRALVVAFAGTLFLYIGWYSSYYTRADLARTVAFITVFMIVFALMPVLRRWSHVRAEQVVLLLPFANAFVYFTELWWMLSRQPHRLAYYATALAAFFLAIALALRFRADVVEIDDVAAAHIAIALGFVTIAIPLRFDQASITIGWLAEAAALLIISQQQLSEPARRAFRVLGSVALAGAVFRLFFIDRFHPQHVLFNMRALLYAMAVAILAGIAVTSGRRARSDLWRFAVLAANAVALIGLSLEERDAFRGSPVIRNFGLSALWMLYGAALIAAGFRRRVSYFRWLALAVLGITTVKVFLYDLSELERIYRVLAFLALGVLLLAISFAYQRKWLTIPADESAGDNTGTPP